jgi:hypothetical protein
MREQLVRRLPPRLLGVVPLDLQARADRKTRVAQGGDIAVALVDGGLMPQRTGVVRNAARAVYLDEVPGRGIAAPHVIQAH